MIDIKKYEKTIKKSGHKIKDINYIKEEKYTDFVPFFDRKRQPIEVRLEPLISQIEIHFKDGMRLCIPIFTEYYY